MLDTVLIKVQNNYFVYIKYLVVFKIKVHIHDWFFLSFFFKAVHYKFNFLTFFRQEFFFEGSYVIQTGLEFLVLLYRFPSAGVDKHHHAWQVVML